MCNNMVNTPWRRGIEGEEGEGKRVCVCVCVCVAGGGKYLQVEGYNGLKRVLVFMHMHSVVVLVAIGKLVDRLSHRW